MTTRADVRRLYIPSPGQPDAAARAAALGAVLLAEQWATDSRYATRITTLPSVILDFGYEVQAIAEPTTHAAVDAAQDAELEEWLPTTATLAAGLASAIASHATAQNPHSITPATIGAAEDDHTHESGGHSHGDADLPAGLARDAEVAAMYAPIHGHPYSSDTHNHDASYAPTHAHPYAATSHAHVDADIPAGIARDSEVTTAIANHAAASDPHSGYASDGDLSTHTGAAAPHSGHATTAQITSAITSHEEAADPHGSYATSGEVTAAVTAHAGAGDPHTGYATDADLTTHAATPHGGASGGVIRKTGNQTMTATSQTAVTDMSFAVAANSTYYFRMDVVITTSTGTSPTTNWAFTGPAGATVSIVGEIDTSTSVEASPAPLTSFTTFGALAQVAATGAKFQGTVQTGGTAGTVQLTVARGGTNPSMVVAAGSNGMWLKVA